jgi:hypothetical protein
MANWIKMRMDLATCPKVVRIMSAISSDKFRTIGGLHAVWCVYDQHSTDGVLAGYTAEIMDSIIGWPGFSRAMIAAEWLQETPEGLVMPRFDEHNGSSAKKRAEDTNAKRVRRMSDKTSDKTRTSLGQNSDQIREEKIREEFKRTPTPLDKPQPDQTALPGAAALPPDSGKPKRSRPRKPVDPIMIPDALAIHPGFAEQWAAWEAYRRESKKTLTTSTRNSQLLMLSRHGPAKAIEMLSRSITNGWTGLFPADGDGGSKGPRKASNESTEYKGAKPLPEEKQEVPF